MHHPLLLHLCRKSAPVLRSNYLASDGPADKPDGRNCLARDESQSRKLYKQLIVNIKAVSIIKSNFI